MSIQRWNYYSDTGAQPMPDGEWVTYADHVAAVAAAEQRVRDEFMDSTPELTAYRKQQYAAGVKAAREAIRNTPTDPRWNILQIERSFLAAIDGVQP